MANPFAEVPVHLFVVTLFLGLLALAALSDIAELRIPNRICLAIVALYPVHVLSSPVPVDWPWALAVAAAMFAVFLIGFATGVVGGGDVKLMAATALWAGPSMWLMFVLVMAVAGGAIGLMMMSRFRFALAWMCDVVGERTLRDALLSRALPYGIAICIAGYVVIGPGLLAR